MTKNFLKLMRYNKPWTQEAPRILRIPKNPHLGFIFELQKTKGKGKTLKESKGKMHFIYRGTRIRITSDFSSETRQARQEW